MGLAAIVLRKGQEGGWREGTGAHESEGIVLEPKPVCGGQLHRRHRLPQTTPLLRLVVDPVEPRLSGVDLHPAYVVGRLQRRMQGVPSINAVALDSAPA